MFHKISRGFYVRDGIYYYKFKLKGQKAICRSTEIKYDGTKNTEQVALDEFQKAKLKAKSTGIYDLPSTITVTRLFKNYLETYVRIESPRSYKRCGLPAAQHFQEYFKDKKASHAIKQDFLDLRTWCMGTKFLSPSTINRYLGMLRACYSMAVEEGFIKINPIATISPFREKHRTRIASNDEIDQLWNEFSDLLKDILIFEVATGLRKGEIINLEWAHINFEKRFGRIPDNKERNIFKIVSFHDDAMEILMQRYKTKKGLYVFCTEDGLQLKYDGVIRTEFNRIRSKLGIKDLRFHDLRHSFGTNMVEDSGNIHATSKAMGHSDVTVTDKIYTQVRNNYMLREVNKMRSHLSRIRKNSDKFCHVGVTVNVTEDNYHENR